MTPVECTISWYFRHSGGFQKPRNMCIYIAPQQKTFLRCLPPLFPKGAGVMVKYLDAAFITADKKNTDVLALYPEMPV